MNRFSLWIFVLLVLTSVILGLVTYQVTGNIQNLIRQSAQIDRSNQLLIKLSEVIGQMRNAQSLVNNYIIARDEKLLAKYKNVYLAMDSSLIGLENISIDDVAQRERALNLARYVRTITTQMNTILNTRGVTRSMQEEVASNAVESDNATAQANQIKTLEQAKLNALRDANNSELLTTITISAVGLVTCISIFLFLFWLIDRESMRRSRNERALQEMVEQMEHIQREMRQINNLTDYLQSCREMDEIYKLVNSYLPTMLPDIDGILGVYNNSRNIIETVAQWGGDTAAVKEGVDGKYFMPEDCWALRRGAVHYVQSGSNNPHCTHTGAEHASAALCFPMVAHGETIGIMHLRGVADYQINSRTQQLIRTISEHISMAIANIRLEQTLRMQSLRDPLTQLYNRRYMEASLEREIFRAKRRNDPVSIIMIDIDHFKRLNDAYGHETGDYVLTQFALLMQNLSRGEDIACRYGGEEFVLIMPCATTDVAEKRAEKLRVSMSEMVLNHNGRKLEPVTLSLGVLTFPDHCDDTVRLIKGADEALYRAKNRGRDRVEIAVPA